jgi:hypothetical protein
MDIQHFLPLILAPEGTPLQTRRLGSCCLYQGAAIQVAGISLLDAGWANFCWKIWTFLNSLNILR